MITLSLLQHLADNGFGVMDESLFYQKLTLDKKGLYIADIGQPILKGQRDAQGYEIYSRGENDIEGYEALDKVREFLKAEYSKTCNLPGVEVIGRTEKTRSYNNVTIVKPSTVSNIGRDSNGRMVYAITGQIIY